MLPPSLSQSLLAVCNLHLYKLQAMLYLHCRSLDYMYVCPRASWHLCPLFHLGISILEDDAQPSSQHG